MNNQGLNTTAFSHTITQDTRQEKRRGIEWSLRALAGMRAARLFLRARATIKYVLRAASTLKNTDGEQRALRKFSRRNLDFSLLKRNVLRHAIWLTPLNR